MRRIVLVLLAALAGCATAPKADFVLTNKPLSPNPIAGFGVCMNPYLYAYPNTPDEINPQQLADLEAKVKALHPQFVRIFFLPSWLDRDTDDSIAKGHPGMRQSLIRTIRLAQDAGASVLLQLWYDPNRYQNPDATARRFAQAIAELRNKDGLTSIRYATIQNEPNEHEDDDGITMPRYIAVYRAFDQSLRELGLRDQVKIIGGDLVREYQERWLAMLGRDLSPVLDGYSIHTYWDYWNIDTMLHHLRDTSAIVAKMPRSARKPVYVTEFGAQGFRAKPSIEPGLSDTGEPVADVPVYSFEMAIFLLEAINDGVVATAQWDAYDIWYDRKMSFGLIGSVETDFKLKPGYRLLSLFTRTTSPGWRAVKITGTQEDVWIAALRGNLSNEQTVFVLNRTRGRRAKMITLAGLEPNRPLHVTFWNADQRGELLEAKPVAPDSAGRLTLTIPHYALVALTTP